MIERTELKLIQTLFRLFEFFELEHAPREKAERAQAEVVELAGAPCAIRAKPPGHDLDQARIGQDAAVTIKGAGRVFAPGFDEPPAQHITPASAPVTMFQQRVIDPGGGGQSRLRSR